MRETEREGERESAMGKQMKGERSEEKRMTKNNVETIKVRTSGDERQRVREK